MSGALEPVQRLGKTQTKRDVFGRVPATPSPLVQLRICLPRVIRIGCSGGRDVSVDDSGLPLAWVRNKN